MRPLKRVQKVLAILQITSSPFSVVSLNFIIYKVKKWGAAASQQTEIRGTPSGALYFIGRRLKVLTVGQLHDDRNRSGSEKNDHQGGQDEENQHETHLERSFHSGLLRTLSTPEPHLV